MYLNIGDMQVGLEKIKEVINNYLEVLIILRIIHRTIYIEVFNILYKIRFIYKMKDKYSAYLNSFYQVLSILRKLQGEKVCIIVILYKYI